MSVRTDFSARAEPLEKTLHPQEREYDAVFAQLVVPVEAFAALHARLLGWLEDQEPMEAILIDGPDQRLRLWIGADPGYISDRHHPLVRIGITCIDATFEARWILDQTCVREAAEGVDATVKALAGHVARLPAG